MPLAQTIEQLRAVLPWLGLVTGGGSHGKGLAPALRALLYVSPPGEDSRESAKVKSKAAPEVCVVLILLNA